MITLIEVVEGYEPYFEVWGSNDRYLGEVHMEELDQYLKGVTASGCKFEIVSAS